MINIDKLYFKSQFHEKKFKMEIKDIKQEDKNIISALYIISSMEMFYEEKLIIKGILNKNILIEYFKKSSSYEKTMVRIAMNLYTGFIDENFIENEKEDFNMARIFNYILDDQNTLIVLYAYRIFCI